MTTEKRSDSPASPSNLSRDFFRAVLLALALVAALFIAFAIAERLWLSDADPKMLRVLYLSRGLLSSLLAAVIVGWFTIRRSPPLLPPAPFEDRSIDEVGESRKALVENYVRWFIQMRWFVVVVAEAVVVVSVFVVNILPTEVFVPLTITVAMLAASNEAYSLLYQRGAVKNSLLQIQVYADLVILTALLHYSGGIENPLTLLMLLHVIISGVVLSRRQCYMVALFASAMLGGLAYLEANELIEHYTLLVFPHNMDQGVPEHAAHDQVYVATRVLLHAVILLFVAYFVTTLADRLRDEERQLEMMAIKAKRTQQLLERSLRTTGTSLRILDRTLQTQWANTLWEETFGAPGAEGKPTGQADPGRAAAEAVLKSGSPITSEVMVQSPGVGTPHGDSAHRSRRIVQITTAPLIDQKGRVQQIVELGQDVTEQKNTYAQLIRAGQLAAVGELAGHVAHEINNPIGIISAKARLMLFDQREEMSDEVAQEIQKMIDLSDRVANIAKGLLSSSRPSTTAQHLIHLQDPIHKALSMIHQRAVHAGIEIEERLLEELPPIVANAQEIEQVFLNLLLNAIDAMPKGGRLMVDAAQAPTADAEGKRWVVVKVGDTGYGVSPETAERVFDPFFTTKGEGHGTGLGLAICQGILRSHSGQIRFESVEGEGTQVSVMFPPGSAEDQRDGEIQSAGG